LYRDFSNDCDIYKNIYDSCYKYNKNLEEVNGNCCNLKNEVECDIQNNITYAIFYSTLSCTFESLIEQLAKLPKLRETVIYLDDKPISSTIQNLTQIKKLKIKYTLKNYYKIPKEIGNLVNLEELDLSESHFVGNIPNEYGKLVNLTKLDLHGNFLDGYVPYEFKNLENLDYLDLSENNLKGFVPPIENISTCRIKENSEMCYLKSSRCRSDTKECTLNEIRTTNNNNGNPNPNSGEFENEKEIFETTNKNTKNPLLTFIVSVAIAVSVIIVIAIIISVIIRKLGKRKHKFSRFDNDSNNNNNNINNNNINSGNINNINYNTANNITTTVTTPQPVTYSYSYNPTQPMAPAAPIYYSVPSPVPAATQPLTYYVSQNPATPYSTIPTSHPGMSYGSPVQSPPPPSSTYSPPQKEVTNLPIPVDAIPVDAIPVDATPIETTTTSEMNNNLPLPLLEEPEHSPDDVLPPYESLSRSLGRPQ